MLNKDVLLGNMIKHFPRWMDIRKRVKTSIGGKMLLSVASETEKIQEAIEDYKKDFFIESYYGKEEDIVDYLYRIQVGKTDMTQLKITSHKLILVADIRSFYSVPASYYYEDGYLFFKPADIGNGRVEYMIGNYIYRNYPEIFHVWNVFDEFAAFVGLERHIGEKNIELEERILHVFKGKSNSTEDGLKHSIISELMAIDKSISEDDIKIEGVTPDNLRKKYDEYNTVLEKLASINKDSYKYKQWDIDPWFYEIRSIDYIPHAWDYALKAFQDGVGKEDDLSVIINESTGTTDAIVYVYKKDEAKLTTYLNNEGIEKDIALKLTKFNEELKQNIIKYKITADKVYDITQKDIGFEYSSIEYINNDFLLMDIINEDQDLSEFSINDMTVLPDEQKFKIVFRPDGLNKNLEINECIINDGTFPINLLKENARFMQTNDGIRYKGCKFYASNANDYSEITNFDTTEEGITMKANAREAYASINVSELGGEIFVADFSSDYSKIPLGCIGYSNFELIKDVYYSTESDGETEFNIIINANSAMFTTNGKCNITIKRDGEMIKESYCEKREEHVIGFQEDLSMYEIRIVSASKLETLTISELKYTNFKVKIELEDGDFINTSHGRVLPAIKTNMVKITMESYYDKAPSINGIFIGTPYEKSITYETEAFTTNELSRARIKYLNMKADLIALDENNNEILNSEMTIIDYIPKKEYIARSNDARLELNLSRFAEIDKISAGQSVVKTEIWSGGMRYFISVKKDELVHTARISGKISKNNNEAKLTDIFSIDTTNGDKLYITNGYPGFIKDIEGVQTKVKLSDIAEIKSAFIYGSFRFKNVDNSFSQVFIGNFNNNETISEKYDGSLSNAILKSKERKSYIAFNEQNVIQKQKDFVQIENTFSPMLANDNSNYYYEINGFSEYSNIKFHKVDADNRPVYHNENWSIGKKYITIINDTDMHDGENYLKEVIKITRAVRLQKNIELESMISDDSGAIHELSKYDIEVDDGYEVMYISADIINDSIETSPNLFHTQAIQKQTCGYNKLNHCNIDKILRIGIGDINTDEFVELEKDMYSLLEKEGIIVWNANSSIYDNLNISILYCIRIPAAIRVDDDIIYSSISYNKEAYLNSGEVSLAGVNDGYELDISSVEGFSEEALTIAYCTNPDFNIKKLGNKIIFNKRTSADSLYIKAGYYYINGQEYYMFAGSGLSESNNIMNVKFYNTEKTEKEMFLQKASNNYVNNSMLLLDSLSEVYSKDFNEDGGIDGVSNLNSITACSSFNHWETVGCTMSITKGMNGLGLKMVNNIRNGYAYIDITNSINGPSLISMLKNGEIKLYIGAERTIVGSEYGVGNSIEIIGELSQNANSYNAFEYEIYPIEGKKYYLITQGSGIVDDIIVSGINEKSIDRHRKNIDAAGLSIEENFASDYTARLIINNKNGYKNIGAEMTAENIIRNSSMINWGITKIKEYSTYDDWLRCDTENVSIKNNMIISKDSVGKITTDPIFVGDNRTIKSLKVKINDVEVDQMSGMSGGIYTCDTIDGTFELRKPFNENTVLIQERDAKTIKKYIQMQINMPPDKVINTLAFYIEYKENKEISPVEKINSNGSLITEILDAQFESKFKLEKVDIDKISDINDVEIKIRGAKENHQENVWTAWKNIDLNNEYINDILFDGHRFFQISVKLKNRNAHIRINNIDLKVVN